MGLIDNWQTKDIKTGYAFTGPLADLNVAISQLFRLQQHRGLHTGHLWWWLSRHPEDSVQQISH